MHLKRVSVYNSFSVCSYVRSDHPRRRGRDRDVGSRCDRHRHRHSSVIRDGYLHRLQTSVSRYGMFIFIIVIYVIFLNIILINIITIRQSCINKREHYNKKSSSPLVLIPDYFLQEFSVE